VFFFACGPKQAPPNTATQTQDETQQKTPTSNTDKTQQAEPQADFSFYIDTKNLLAVEFKDASNNATSWHWDFGENGDQDTSIEKDPTYRYSTEGEYKVLLTVADKEGKTSTITKTVRIQELPVPKIELKNEQDSTNPALFNFSVTLNTPDVTKMIWDFGDGSTQETDASVTHVSHVYSVSQDVIVTLTAFNQYNKKTSMTNKINPIVLTVISSFLKNIRPEDPSKVEFLNFSTNASSYEWDFGDGQKSTDAQPTHIYEKSGTYTVRLLSKGVGDKTNTSTDTVTIQYIPKNATLGYKIDPLRLNYFNTVVYFIQPGTRVNSVKFDYGLGFSNTHEYLNLDNSDEGLRSATDDYALFDYSDPVTLTVTIHYLDGEQQVLQQQLQPLVYKNEIRLTQVNLYRIPDKDVNGRDYDSFSEPDLFVRFNKKIGSYYFFNSASNGISDRRPTGTGPGQYMSFNLDKNADYFLMKGNFGIQILDDDSLTADIVSDVLSFSLLDILAQPPGTSYITYLKDFSDTKRGGELYFDIMYERILKTRANP